MSRIGSLCRGIVELYIAVVCVMDKMMVFGIYMFVAFDTLPVCNVPLIEILL